MFSARMRNIIAKLIFLLSALDGKRGNRRSELVVPKSLQPRGGQKINGDGKIESFADRRIAHLRVMKSAGLQRKHPQSCRRKLKLLAQQYAVVVRVRRRSRRRQR